MANPNRVKVWYRYRCLRCQRKHVRGSRAKKCDVLLVYGGKCGGPLLPLGRYARTRLRLLEEMP